PSILGGLLDAVAGALARHPKVTLPTLPRMADFASWAVAAEPNLGCAKEGIFLAAYEGNRAQAHVLALEASPIAGAVRTLAGRGGGRGRGRGPSSGSRGEASPLRPPGGRRAGKVPPASSAAPFVAWSHPSERSASW